MPNSFLYLQAVLYRTIQFSLRTQFKCQKQLYLNLFSLINEVKCIQVLQCITNNSIKHQSFIYSQLNIKTILFQIIQFSISIPVRSIWPIYRNLSGVTTPGPLCNGYCRWKWTRRHEFKSWTRHFISHSTNTLGKGMNPIILPPAMGK